MTGSIRNFEKLNFTPKSSVFCFSQGQTSKYDRLAQQQQIAENVPSCNYCAATIVARPLRTTVKGKKPAFRVVVKSNLTSLIHRIQESGRVSGRKTFVDSYELLASCHVLT